MRPALCDVDVDVRVPPGVTTRAVADALARAAARHAGEGEVLHACEPNLSDTTHELFRALVRSVEAETAAAPLVAVGLGCTDARLWRLRGVPAAIYGPPPAGMGAVDERVRIEDLLACGRVHARTAHDLLAA
jgi:succinyl-diaminopimelate desuccinylase